MCGMPGPFLNPHVLTEIDIQQMESMLAPRFSQRAGGRCVADRAGTF